MTTNEKIKGRSVWDLFVEHRFFGIVVLLIVLIIVCSGLYFAYFHGINVSYKNISLNIGKLDTISKTENMMRVVEEVANQVSNKTNSPDIKDNFRILAGNARQLIDKSVTTRARILAINENTSPQLKEKIIKDVFLDYGLSQELLNHINIGIVDKYLENETLKTKINELVNENAQKDRKIRLLVLQNSKLQNENRDLKVRITDIEKLLINNKDTSDIAAILYDSLQAELDRNNKLLIMNGEFASKLNLVKPFEIVSSSIRLVNVATKKNGDFRKGQIKGSSIKIKLSSVVNPAFNKSMEKEYIVSVRFSFASKANGQLRQEEKNITIKPGAPFEEIITLNEGLGGGNVLVHFYLENRQIWKDILSISKIGK